MEEPYPPPCAEKSRCNNVSISCPKDRSNGQGRRKNKDNNNNNKKKVNIIIRKRLGCRRTLQDMLSKTEEKYIECDDDIEEIHIDTNRNSKESRKLQTPPPRQLQFSPRINASDEDLFPSNHSLYKEPNQRWGKISDQAGSHRQDGTVMTIGRRITPMALRVGLIQQAAIRVRYLNLWLDHNKDTLPEWLDLMVEVFVNLRHVTLTQDVFNNDDLAVSARMRRLYVLYRLPNLKSIDDMIVTQAEREMANPSCAKLKKRESPAAIIQQCYSYDTGEIDDDLMFDATDYDSDTRVMPAPLLFHAGSTESAVGEIGVELLTTKFQEINQTKTNTTSPTTNSDTTMTAINFDDDGIFLFEYDNGLVGPTFLKEDSSKMNISIDSHAEVSSLNGDFVGMNTRERKKQNYDSMDHSVGQIMNRIQPGAVDNESDIIKARVRTLHDNSNNNIELISVASTDLEWSAACGILTFRKDRACAPRIRLPFRNRKIKSKPLSSDVCAQACLKVVGNLRNKQREKENNRLKACTPVQRQSKVISVTTPQVGCCELLKVDISSKSMFFPPGRRPSISSSIPQENVSANKQLPPSKSLTSPFPMQFRKCQQNSKLIPFVVQLEAKACQGKNHGKIQSIDTSTTVYSSIKDTNRKPKTPNKKELPPTCPSGRFKRQVTVVTTPKERKSKRQLRRLEISKENARSTSVMDFDEEEFGGEDYEIEEYISDDELRISVSDDELRISVSDFELPIS